MNGNPPLAKAVVLLSGGLDSVAALCWAQQRYTELRALSFDYGQPNVRQEVPAAQRSAGALGVPWGLTVLAEALRPEVPRGLLAGHINPGPPEHGISPAFVPGRNLLFLTIAAAHASTWWPTGNLDVVIGACAEDASGFPDCRPEALDAQEQALCAGLARRIHIRAPWLGRTKREILYAVQPHAEAFELVRQSWSCYSGAGPCGICPPCRLRCDAFAQLGVEDLQQRTIPYGGDPQRDRRVG